MADQSKSWTLEELAEESDTPVRTIRYYISEGLLPKPQGRGRGTVYAREHLQRLLLIRRLVSQRLPLHEIRDQITVLSPSDLEGLLEDTRSRQVVEEAARTASPKEYVSALLARATEDRQAPRNQQALFAQSMACEPEPIYQAVATQSGLWKRYELAPGVELHVSRVAEKRERGLIQGLLEFVSKEGRRS
jgi:DNA-binding transcriptional MerR regulator